MQVALLAGTHSGCGKTTVMLALLQYFRAQQLRIRAFKAGPDYLDPLWHQAITGWPSYNLDTRMMGEGACLQQLSSQVGQADMALIEGVMGLFDGVTGVGGEGSSVDLARVVGCPVILVVDARGMSGTIAALVSGFVAFAADKNVRIAGIVANKVGSAYHAEILRNVLQDFGLPPLLAWMARNEQTLTERHLGLKMPETDALPDYLPSLQVEQAALMAAFNTFMAISPMVTGNQRLAGKIIAVAKDAACSFIYPANVDWLQANGATLLFFSPLAGEPVPTAADAVWLPGGYPELHASELSNSSTWVSLTAFINANKPVLAECGGAMLLGKAIVDIAGKQWPMAGVLPYVSMMQPRLAALGHRTEQSGMRGHEFHYSRRAGDVELKPAFEVDRGDAGVRYKNLRASYIHWYFSSGDGHVAACFGTGLAPDNR